MPGDCHYLEGNLNARRRVEYIQTLLEQIGLEKERIQMVNISAAMGAQFAQKVSEFTEMIQTIGPNPLANKQGLDIGD
jgi:coenzyme F420-reducing hydrogenase delta subunit